jgi:tetratricopeptide (TPR) repeat protein
MSSAGRPGVLLKNEEAGRRQAVVIAARASSLGGTALAILLCAGCGNTPRLAYSRDEMRTELARRAVSSSAAELVVPFEVDAASVELASRAIAGRDRPAARVRALAQSLFDPEFFGIRYTDGATRTARETLQSREGNCMSIASAFVGLARALGMDAYFVDVSTTVNELESQSQMAVRIGHVTAFVETGSERLALDVSKDIPVMRDYRILSDLEVAAHTFNNRGFERIASAQPARRAVDWWGALRDFQIALEIYPEFAQAKNNAGIVWSHLGEPVRAKAAFREAIARDPKLAAPYNNLGQLLSQQGDHAGALECYRRALELEPKSAHVRLNLGLALARHGDREGAKEQAQAALALDASCVGARELLEELTPRPPVAAPAPVPLAAVAKRPPGKAKKLRLGAGTPLGE